MKTTGPDKDDLNQAAHALSKSIGRFYANHFTLLDKPQNKHIKEILDKALDIAYDVMDVCDNLDQGDDDDKRSEHLHEGEEE